MAEQTTQLLCADPERHALAQDAALALAGLAGPLQFLTSGQADPQVDAAHQLAIRVEHLAGVLLTLLTDERGELEETRYLLYGPEMHRRMRREAANG
jgi:hypothetical protein